MTPLHDYIAKDGFRLRGLEVSRLDSFSDVVFGFALTLIVASLEVPKTYLELHETLLNFVPFFICALFLFMVWWAHYRFFRRYDLHDPGTIVLNGLLLFTVLLYAYPLKFLRFMFTRQLMPQRVVEAGAKVVPVFTSVYQVREMMVVYSVGFAAVYFCFAALYANAWRQRLHLRLNELEKTLTLCYLWDSVSVGAVGLLVIATAYVLPPGQSGLAGFVFFAIALVKTVHGRVTEHKKHAALARTPHHERTCSPKAHG